MADASLSINQFQFHKGTIKTYQEQRQHGYYANFNSIKVRLKQHKKNDKLHKYDNFNSIKVRLKHKIQLMTRRPAKSFQFHKGTIKTDVVDTTHQHTIISIP